MIKVGLKNGIIFSEPNTRLPRRLMIFGMLILGGISVGLVSGLLRGDLAFVSFVVSATIGILFVAPIPETVFEKIGSTKLSEEGEKYYKESGRNLKRELDNLANQIRNDLTDEMLKDRFQEND